MTKMWTNVLILTLIAAVSSRVVEENEDTDIVNTDNVFEHQNNDTQDSVYTNSSEYDYPSESRRLEIVDTSKYRLTTESTEEHANQSTKQSQNQGNRNRSFGGANRDNITRKITKKTEENGGDPSSVKTRPAYVNIRSKVNPREAQQNTTTKTLRNSTTIKPVTENVTENIQTLQPVATTAAAENTTLKYTNDDKQLVEVSKDQSINATTFEKEVSTTKASTESNVDEDKLTSDSTTKMTTIPVGLGDRNIFDVEDCPTGMVKFGMKCVDED